MTEPWKRCSTCKKDIPFGATWYACSVSTCNRKRTGLHFCSVECWDQHLPIARHREAWAVEEKAPSEQAWAAQQAGESGGSSSAGASSDRGPSTGKRRVVASRQPEPAPGPREILVVASRLKDYIRKAYGMNTSDGVLEPLSDELRRLAARAADNAREDGRKTVLDRDFDFLKRRG